jgi:predicted ATPase/class 3 adenylate cyclase
VKEAEALRQAISVISGQRLLLGDEVVAVTVTALRAKLAAVENGGETAVSIPDRAAQRKYLTILFAHVSGFTEATQILPNTQMLNLINLLWRRLDGVITAHGGMVDKHMGDAVMGLFGVPIAGEDDSERAVRAALEMRSVLTQFTAEMRAEFAASPALDTGGTGVLAALDALHLRVGINTGPVLVGEIGAGNEYTVIGDAVNVASRLEQKAPRDSILISHETYQLIRGAFDMEPLGPMHLKGKQKPIPVYLVSGVRSRIFAQRGRGVEGVETEMVGRDKELLFLQTSLRDVIKSGKGKVITVVGEAGIGKSRLIHEYNRWVKALPVKVNILRGHTEPSMKHLPYSLARDLFVTFFGIQENDPASVVKTKINQHMERYFPKDTPEKSQQRSRAFAQLLGLNMEEDLELSLLPETFQAREETFKDLTRLLHKAVAGYRAGLLILEDMHWADEGSLELIDYLVELCRDTPLLILCVTRSSLLDYHATWGLAENGAALLGQEPVLQQTVVLKMLAAPQCRQLVENILRYLPQIPPALSDLIVHRSEGNPFYVEELVKVLIEDGVIVPGEASWRVLKKELTDVRIPLTLTGVLQARLDRLSSLERVTIQRAAVIGRVFWDSTVMAMNDVAEETAVHAPETITALQALERREMIFQRSSSMFTGSSAYLFKHEMLREVAYESVLLRMRPAYHKQVADWLVQEGGERVAEYAGLIADHYEKAEQWLPAAEMYERAGVRAQELSNPELALTHFKKVFALIEPEPHQNAWKVSVLEQIAQLLHLQARLVEAVTTLNLMRQAAELDGDLLAQTKALGALSRIQYEQQLYEAAWQAADKAEQIAWLVGDDLELVRILLTKSLVYRHLSDPIQAAPPAQQALGIAERLGSSDMIVACLKTLTLLAIDAGRQAHVEHYTARLQALINRLDQAKIELATIGAGFVALGEIYNRLGRYDKVARPLLLAVRIFKKLDDQQGAAQALDLLGESGRLRGDNDQAAPFYREALAIASATGNVVGEMWYRVHLAASRCGLAQYDLAEKEILRVLHLAEDRARFAHWQGLSFAYSQLAMALHGLNRVTEALAAAQKALAHGVIMADDRLVGWGWYGLGLTSASLPQTALPISVNDKTYMPGDCFNESLRLLRRANGDSTGAFREQALVLWAWAQYETSLGNRPRSQILRYEARAVADEIGLSLGA